MNVKQIPILNADAVELSRISQEGLLSLNLAEMQAIQTHFARLERNPTDVELETIAQTWSEHCVHKTFKSMIEYAEKGRETEMVDGLFKTYIQGATQKIGAEWCVSVFTDNAGIIEFDDRYNIVFQGRNAQSSLCNRAVWRCRHRHWWGDSGLARHGAWREAYFEHGRFLLRSPRS